jgi:hypothetical protein
MSEISKEEGVIAETTLPPALSDAPSTKPKGKKAKSEKEAVELPTALIEVPLGESDSGYISNRVDVHLSAGERSTMKRVLNGLKSRGARLQSGKPIWSNADVVRWMLEQVG